ncbi:type II toxin-antitoxin system prevent-host-death family antitoxin [Ottowia oryzae]|nr:type II toxin-antitoxin system prevent-host-death family antitoxin [Ottowia oryzae]
MSVARPTTLDDLPRTAASNVKKLGWRGVMREVGRTGSMVVTNHDRPEAVILSLDEYRALVLAAEASLRSSHSALDTLRHDFDERLAALTTPDAGERLRDVFGQSPALGGQVRAGQGY